MLLGFSSSEPCLPRAGQEVLGTVSEPGRAGRGKKRAPVSLTRMPVSCYIWKLDSYYSTRKGRGHQSKASINTTILKCPGWCTWTCHTSCTELLQSTNASCLPMSLLTSHGTPCSPLGRSHLHPDPADPAPEQPRGLPRHRNTRCSVLLPTKDKPHYAELGRADTFFLYNGASQPYMD